MNGSGYRALVVDDEPAVRRLTVDSLQREGFQCDAAQDGLAARELLDRHLYDLVVTDLRMPNGHGHALAVQLLAMDRRPVVAVLTAVAEPRIAKDLIARGVDELTFKPVDFTLLGAKLRAMVNRRAVENESRGAASASGAPAPDHEELTSAIETVDLDARLAQVSRILPLNPVALDVYALSNNSECVIERFVVAMRQDPSLAAEVLRLANSSLYNPTGERISKLEDAVLRIGQKQVGEVALASNALAALTAGMLPWIDSRTISQRSIAASLAMEFLIVDGGHRHVDAGLQLGVMMHALGRVALGTLFPQSYDRMLAVCSQRNAALSDQEMLLFGESQATVMARLLRLWQIPADAYLPLKYIDDEYSTLVRLSEPTRIKAELIKLAVLAGQLAVGTWNMWDLLELPPPALLKRLRIKSLAEVIDRVRCSLHDNNSPASSERVVPPDPAPTACRSLTYFNLAGGAEDVLAQMLDTMKIKLLITSREISDVETPVLINCLEAPLHRLSARVNPRAPVRPLIVCKPEVLEKCSQFGWAVSLPGSFGSLKQLVEEYAFNHQCTGDLMKRFCITSGSKKQHHQPSNTH